MTRTLCILTLFGAATAAADEISFNRDIRPLLSENCFACHGPDEHERKAKLRLDLREGGAFEERDGVIAIVPGKPDKSELLFRLTTDDTEELMPPPKSEKKLTPEQIALVKQWIAEGAKYEGHWAYESPSRPAVPEGANPIDFFINQRLEKEGLAASGAAAAHTLIRRLSHDITGLPPTSAETAAFEKAYAADPNSAIAAAAKRLLESERHGERMAVFWLDLVRYADSIGYHSDNPMSVFPYREWVISAFNSNMPFDQFTREQLAGDLLPDATQDQKVASGYNRLLQTTQEGGAQAKEYLAIYAADRVRNISGTWLGGTLGCAQCHDHKYDPYSAKDFYSMAAFFADVQEKGVGQRGGSMAVVTASHRKRVVELEAGIKAIEETMAKPSPQLEAAQAEWEKGIADSAEPSFGEWRLLGPLTGGDLNKVFDTTFGPENGVDANAAIQGKKWQKREFPDGAVHALPNNGNAAWYLYRTIKAPKASQLALSLGSDDGIRVWVNGEQVLSHNIGRGAAPDQEKITISLRPGFNHFLMKIVNGGGGAGFYFNAGGSQLPAAITEIAAIPAADRNDAQRAEMAKYYRGIAPLLAKQRAEIATFRQQRAEIDKQLPQTLITVATNPREMRILPRGNWLDDSGEVVQPAIPAFLGSLETKGERANRIDLANWVVSKDNPLTARTFANRLWKLYFGAGLSRNVDDLGSQGQWPSHPELLDWLAVEFIESGWDVRHMIELMVNSQAYRRSAIDRESTRERDPLNSLLARQSRFRLDAEMVRDSALSIGGILVERVGGPSVKPYQPAGYWEHLNFPGRTWQHDNNDNQYRRALYTHWQRSFLHPSLLAFDAPSREECTAERPRSNTPLQALILLNDPTYVEAARAFGERIVKSGGADPMARIDWAFREAVSRAPSAREAKILADLQASQQKRYADDEAAAKTFLTVGMRPPPDGIDPAELASWTAVARAILNLHEIITRQ